MSPLILQLSGSTILGSIFRVMGFRIVLSFSSFEKLDFVIYEIVDT